MKIWNNIKKIVNEKIIGSYFDKHSFQFFITIFFLVVSFWIPFFNKGIYYIINNKFKNNSELITDDVQILVIAIYLLSALIILFFTKKRFLNESDLYSLNIKVIMINILFSLIFIQFFLNKLSAPAFIIGINAVITDILQKIASIALVFDIVNYIVKIVYFNKSVIDIYNQKIEPDTIKSILKEIDCSDKIFKKKMWINNNELLQKLYFPYDCYGQNILIYKMKIKTDVIDKETYKRVQDIYLSRNFS